MNSAIFKALLPHAGAIALMVVLNALFFMPQFQGKAPRQGDIVSWEAASKEIRDYRDQKGEQLLWTNAMFGGMPAYQIAMEYKGQFISWATQFLNLGFDPPVGVFLAMMIAFYIMLVVMGVHPWLGVVGAIAFGFTTNNFVLFEAGHSNKLSVLVYLPLITAALHLLFYQKRYLIGGAMLALAAAGNLAANHVQMTYYFLLCLLILGVLWIVETIREQSWSPLAKTLGISVVAALLAVGAVLSNLWPTYEYAQDTMRGKPILESTAAANAGSSSATDGLAWEYAMQWSNNWQDIMAAIVPRAAGGGSGEKVKEGVTYTALRNSGMQVLPDGSMQLPLYWGSLPFTSGPAYFGAIVCFLFFFGLFLVRDSIKWWVGLSVLLTVLLSLGRNMEGFQRLFFDFLPMYNKFRAPSSILTITAFFLPLLGILALSNMVRQKHTHQEMMRALGFAAGITGGVALFFAMLGGSFFDFSSAGDANYQAELTALLRQDRQSLMSKDAWRSFFLIALSAGLIWGYIRKVVQPWMLIVGLGLLITFDLWSVGRRYVGADTFVAKNAYESQFQPRPVDQQILSQESRRGDYRVLDMAVNTFNSSMTSYYHNTIGGYSAAKLQRYQDLIDYHIAKNNTKVLDMLNGKYVITQDQQLQTNFNALGPVWFVDSVIIVKTPNQEIDALNTFNPANHAVVLDQEFGGYIGNFNPEKGGTIRLKEYDPQHLVYETDASSEQLAVFSEIWYGPDKGWKAKIDGKEVPHIRANYALRALRVPAGQHTVEFLFEPKSFHVGSIVSGISSSIILLLFFGMLGLVFWKWLQNPKLPERLISTELGVTPPKNQKKKPQTVISKVNPSKRKQ